MVLGFPQGLEVQVENTNTSSQSKSQGQPGSRVGEVDLSLREESQSTVASLVVVPASVACQSRGGPVSPQALPALTPLSRDCGTASASALPPCKPWLMVQPQG